MNEWIKNPIKEIDQSLYELARNHQLQLTKPPGSLGALEDIAVKFVAWQGTISPIIDNPIIAIFAADHGIANEKVSAFPQAVTTEMIRNFASGGAAISVIAESLNIPLHVIDMGTINSETIASERLKNVISKPIAKGTKNFAVEPAMSAEECFQALRAGAEFVMQAKNNAVDVFIGGEMGIANTSSATAIAAVLLNQSVSSLAGPGTGLDKAAVKNKAAVIQTAIDFHGDNFINEAGELDPILVLQTIGGFEIAALAGAYLACAQYGIPVLVDGFICSVAALVTTRIAPQAKEWMCFTHQSAEPGHQIVLDALKVKPLLSLNMRLGEASGAALAFATIKLAINLHNNMATFEQAAVSNKE
ncbi:MAG: nicotinate-nucleotide--dimethylbenzimidazole phosphoribosyltransferase [Gammaproteobacteria bacterium]